MSNVPPRVVHGDESSFFFRGRRRAAAAVGSLMISEHFRPAI